MIPYDRFYRKIGFNKISMFSTPIIIPNNNIVFPFKTTLVIWDVEDVIVPIKRENLGIDKKRKVYVKSPLELGKNTVGNPRRNANPIIGAFNIIKSKDTTMKFLRPNQSFPTINDRDIVVINYKGITNLYRYPSNIMLKIFKFQNVFNTVLDKVTELLNEDREVFLPIQLPKTIPSFYKLERFSIKLPLETIKSITTYKQLLILELWKYLKEETKKESLFSRLPQDKLENLTLLFSNGENIVLFNFTIFNKLIKDFDLMVKRENYNGTIDTIKDLELVEDFELLEEFKLKTEGSFQVFGTTQFKPIVFRKLLYIMLNKIISDKPTTIINANDDIVVVKQDNTKLSKALTTPPEGGEVKTDVDIEKITDKVIEETIPKTKEAEDSIGGNNLKEETDPDVEAGDEKEITQSNIEFTLQRHTQEEPIKNISLQDIKEEKPINQEMYISDVVTKLKDNGLISKAEENSFKNTLKEQPKKKSPFVEDNKSLTLGDYLRDEPIKEFNIQSAEIADNVVVMDKSFNKNTTKALEKEYLKNYYKKDLMKTIYSIQNNKMVIMDHNIERKENILENTETHNLKVKLLNGATCNLKVDLPKIEEDGTFKMSGNSYILRKQRTEIPIRKIDGLTVVLNSYYGKLFIKKAFRKKEDAGYWYFRTLGKMFESGEINNLVIGSSQYPDTTLPLTYTRISRYIRSFIIKVEKEDFTLYFDYLEIQKMLKDLKLKKVDGIPFGINKNNTKILFLNLKEEVSVVDVSSSAAKPLKNFDELLNIDVSKKPIETISVKIFKEYIPVVVFLSYYIGLESTIRMLKVVYEKVEKKAKKDIDPTKEYMLKFKDVILVLKRDYGIGDLILGALQDFTFLGDVELRMFNVQALFGTIFNYLQLRNIAITEIKLLENMYVDPITKSILEELKLPLTFKGLLVKAGELLLDDNYINPNNMSGQLIRGYERINGMLYKELILALKDYENKSSYTKAKLTLDPFAIKAKLKDDSTTVLLDNLNPITALKQTEDVSYLGEGGRQIVSMVKRTRVRDESEIGIISESVKDNGDVGVTAYLSVDPKIQNVRGMIKPDDGKLEWANAYSTTALMSPFANKDDPKRVKFIGIQSSHIVPIAGAKAPYVRTGYDSVLPVRAHDNFVKCALGKGVVKDVTDEGVLVKYDDKELGEMFYQKKKWTSKEEAETCFTYTVDSALRKGDKLEKDDTILYVVEYFQPDIFNRKRVIYKDGTTFNVALTEDPDTFEDSGSISHKLTETLSTKLTKVRSIVVDYKDEIYDVVKVNQKVEPTDTLFSFSSTGNLDTKDKKLMEILKEIKANSPKAKVQGKIIKVQVFYNCEKKELSHSLHTLATATDKLLIKDKGYPGRVDSSYSIKGKPLLPNEVEIKIYIETNELMGLGDKAIFGNQCKFTVGNIFRNECRTDDGTEVFATFGFTSVFHRIVNSPVLIGTTGMLIQGIENNIIEMYFGKDK